MESVPWSLRLTSTVLTSVNRLVRRRDHTINRWLADASEIRIKANAKPVKGVSSKDVSLDPSNKDLWVRVFTPCEIDSSSSSSKMPVLIYYHGGGFAVLSPDFVFYDIFCRRLARESKCIVVSASYRRSPEHRYPAAHDDGFQVLNWLVTSPEAREVLPGADVSRVVISGDSAGGNIAHHVACRAGAEQGSELSKAVRGLVLANPFFGGEERTPAELRLKNVPVISVESADWHWKAYLPPGEDRDHPMCNVLGKRAPKLESLKLPPTMVLVAELDTLQDWQMRYADGLQNAGKQVEVKFYKGAVHAFHILHKYPLSREAIADMADFIRRHSCSASSN